MGRCIAVFFRGGKSCGEGLHQPHCLKDETHLEGTLDIGSDCSAALCGQPTREHQFSRSLFFLPQRSSARGGVSPFWYARGSISCTIYSEGAHF